jgi:hypothetical protein
MRASMSLRALVLTCLGWPCSAVLALELSVSCPKSSISIYASRVRECQSGLGAARSKASVAAPLHSATACQQDSLARFVSICVGGRLMLVLRPAGTLRAPKQRSNSQAGNLRTERGHAPKASAGRLRLLSRQVPCNIARERRRTVANCQN